MAVDVSQETFKKVVKAIHEIYRPINVELDSNLINDIGLDSLDGVELVMKAEEIFGISINDDEASTIKTVRDMCLLIDRKLANNGTEST